MHANVALLYAALLKGLRSYDLEYIAIALAKTAWVFFVWIDETLAAMMVVVRQRLLGFFFW